MATGSSRRSRRQRPAATSPAPAALPPHALPPAGETSHGASGFHLTRRQWIAFYLVVFAAAHLLLFIFIFGIGGDDRVRRKMLVEADDLKQAGRHQELLELYGDYAKRWPGAIGTRNFEQALGEANYLAGNYEQSAERYERAVRADAKAWDFRAHAGQAWWQAGDKQKAIQLFQDELKNGNPESDIANYYLGLNELEQGNYMKALSHMQSIRNREEFASRIAEVRKQIETDIVEPSRMAAAEMAKLP